MDFVVSRVKVPPAIVLYAKGEIAVAGQAVLERALELVLGGPNPIIVDLDLAGVVAESQISGPILRALRGDRASPQAADRVAVVGVAPEIRKPLEAAMGRRVRVFASQDAALANLGVSPVPLGEASGPTNNPGGAEERPEIDRAEYIAAFECWFEILEEHETYQRLVPGLRTWWAEVDRERLPYRGKVAEFCRLMPRPDCDLGMAIVKSNLLYRLLYLGEPVRKRPCPGVQLTFGKKAFRHHPYSECRCGGCRWLL